MKAWWAGLAVRERNILLAGAGVLLLLLLWLWVWEPLSQARDSLRSDISQMAAEVAWMQQQADQVRRRSSLQERARTNDAGGSVLTLIEVSANAAGIRPALERIQPEANGARLWFEAVGFDALLAWLGELEQRQGLQVTQLAVDVQSQGQVAARVLLEPRP